MLKFGKLDVKIQQQNEHCYRVNLYKELNGVSSIMKSIDNCFI